MSEGSCIADWCDSLGCYVELLLLSAESQVGCSHLLLVQFTKTFAKSSEFIILRLFCGLQRHKTTNWPNPWNFGHVARKRLDCQIWNLAPHELILLAMKKKTQFNLLLLFNILTALLSEKNISQNGLVWEWRSTLGGVSVLYNFCWKSSHFVHPILLFCKTCWHLPALVMRKKLSFVCDLLKTREQTNRFCEVSSQDRFSIQCNNKQWPENSLSLAQYVVSNAKPANLCRASQGNRNLGKSNQ